MLFNVDASELFEGTMGVNDENALPLLFDLVPIDVPEDELKLKEAIPIPIPELLLLL